MIILKSKTRLAYLATGALACCLSLAARADAAKACCADASAKVAGAKAECCADAQAKTAGAKSTCCAASGQYVMLKVKGRHPEALGAALTKIDGVSAVDTCSESKFTKVAYNKDKVCADAIMAAVKEAGYKIETRRVSFAVEGLTCGGCADKASQALSKVKGVSEASVCHESKVATVDYNPNRVKAEKLIAALDAVGFKATESIN